MKSIKEILLAVCMATIPSAGFAKDPPPFAHVSVSIDGAAKRRTVPDFSLIERSGKKVSLADLRGKIWIADFIYTHCTDTCPLQTADMPPEINRPKRALLICAVLSEGPISAAANVALSRIAEIILTQNRI